GLAEQPRRTRAVALRRLDPCGEGFDHRPGAAGGAHARELGLGFLPAFGAHVSERETVTRRGLGGIAPLAHRRLEVLHGVARIALLRAYLGAHQLEFRAV